MFRRKRAYHIQRLLAGGGRRHLDKLVGLGQAVANRIVRVRFVVEAAALAPVLVVVFGQLVERSLGPEVARQGVVRSVVGVLDGRGQRLDLETVSTSPERRLVTSFVSNFHFYASFRFERPASIKTTFLRRRHFSTKCQKSF